jgi:ubiquitin thioesterase protein OTUB1
LIGSKEPLSNLVAEFGNDSIYKGKAETLCGRYTSFRKVRPDGNCFFRGFGFSYFEHLLGNEVVWKSFRDLVHGTKDQLLSQGFPMLCVEDYFDSVMTHSIDTQH